MATQWILDKISGAIQPTIQNGVSAAGGYAGGAFNVVGTGISGVGESINGTIRRYGDGFKDYGNGVMDWTSASGSRAQTASNPLGLSSGSTGGKRAVSTPSVYRAPASAKSSAAKTLTTTAKSQQVKKPSAANKPPVSAAAKKTPVVKPTAQKGAVTSKASGTSKPAVKPVKASTASATQTKTPASQKPNYVAAANPLGLR